MKRTLLATLIAMTAGLLLWAADDDPDPVQTIADNTLTQIEPGGFRVEIVVSPVVKVSGTNTASVHKIYVEKLQVVRRLKDGAQIGDARTEVVERRDATNWMLTRTNVNGVVALHLNPARATWAAAAWSNATP